MKAFKFAALFAVLLTVVLSLSSCSVVSLLADLFAPRVVVNVPAPTVTQQPQSQPQQAQPAQQQPQQPAPQPGGYSGFMMPFMMGPSVVFMDDFEKYDASTKVPFSQWTGDGQVVTLSQYDGSQGKVLKVSGNGVKLEVNMMDMGFGGYLKFAPSTQKVDIYFHLSKDGSQGYYVEIPYATNGEVKLFKKTASGAKMLSSARGNWNVKPGDWRTWGITYQAGDIKVFTQNGLILEYVDSDNPIKSGIFAFKGGQFYLDDVGIASLAGGGY